MLVVLLNPKQLSHQLDPRSIPYTNDFYLLENLTTRLLSLDEKGNYQLDLASSIEPVSEREYYIKIKESYFSNGDQITLEDVKHTLNRSMRLGASHVNLKDIIHSIEIENQTLKVKLKNVSQSFFYYLSLPDLGILHKSQYEKDNILASDFMRVSSGPYSYKAKDNDYYLVKNKYYSLGPHSFPEVVKLLNYFNDEPHKMLVEGKADLGKISLDYYLRNREVFKKHKELRIIGVPSSSLTYLYINPFSNNFKKKEHRLWFKCQVLKHFEVSSDFNWIARQSKQYFPPESKAYLQAEEVDKYLKEIELEKRPSDFPDKIVIHTYSTAYNVTLEVLVKKLESIPGINIEIKNDIEPSTYIDSLKSGAFDIFLNIMSTDFRAPAEAINFEFFSDESPFLDEQNVVKNNFKKYQESESELEAQTFLKKIAKFIIKSDQIIPLFHSAIPYAYNSERVNLQGLNHLFIFNFWKMKSIK